MRGIGFSSLHPLSALVFFLLQFSAALIFNHPAVLLMSFILSAAAAVRLSGREAFSRLLKLYLPLTVFCGAFNSIFSHYGVTALFALPGGNSYTLEALIFGLVFGLRLSVMLMWLDSFNEIITPEKFIYLFGRISPRTALVISMALRFIPLFRKQSREIGEAHFASKAEKPGFFVRLKAAVRNVSILITWIMERGVDTAASMTARGYGAGKRSRYSQFGFRVEDFVLLAFCAAVGALGALSLGSLDCSYNPVIKIAAPGAVSFTFLALFALFGAFPIIYDLEEKKRWTP